MARPAVGSSSGSGARAAREAGGCACVCEVCKNASVGVRSRGRRRPSWKSNNAVRQRAARSGRSQGALCWDRGSRSPQAKLTSCGLLAITTLLCSAPPPPLSARYRAMKGRRRRRPRSSATRLPTVFPAADIAQQESSGKLTPAASSTGVVGRHSSVHRPSPHT